MAKVSIIGAGHVGKTAAFILASNNLAEVVLLDIITGIPQGTAIDISQAGYLDGFNQSVHGTNDYEDISDSDIIVFTAGSPRKPGMSREMLININAGILKEVVKKIKEYSPRAIVITVTNPLDLITLGAYYLLNENRERVFGMSSLLDSARMAYYLAKQAEVSVTSVESMVIGAHNETMVPLIKYSRIDGNPIDQYLSSEQIKQVIQETKKGGETIVSFLKEGSAYYAPAASISRMVMAIINDTKETLPVSTVLRNEYGHSGVALGVPVRLGQNGMEGIIELKLDDEEVALLNQSADSIQSNLNLLAEAIGHPI